MNFTCGHCGKLINCSAILVDKTFLHSTCEKPYKEAKIYAKWEASGLLDGFKSDGKINIATLYDGKTSSSLSDIQK